MEVLNKIPRLILKAHGCICEFIERFLSVFRAGSDRSERKCSARGVTPMLTKYPRGLSSVLEGSVNLLNTLDSCGSDVHREALGKG